MFCSACFGSSGVLDFGLVFGVLNGVIGGVLVS